MSEPTIEELIQWVRDLDHYIKGDVVRLGASNIAVVGVRDLNVAVKVIGVLEQHLEGSDWCPSRLLACSECGDTPSRLQERGEIRFYCDKCDIDRQKVSEDVLIRAQTGDAPHPASAAIEATRELNAIRAFVERVESRVREWDTDFYYAIQTELDALEKANARTND
jgi:hypothetical protein